MSEPPTPAPPVAEEPRRRRRIARWTALTVALGAVLLVAGAAWLVSTRAGARVAVEQLSQMLPGRLAVGSVEGPVRGPMTLRDVRYETERFVVTLAEVRFDWRLRELRRRVIDITSLEARGVRIRILPSEEVARRELHDINLRYSLVLRSVRIEDVEVLRPGSPQPVVVDRFTMETGAWRDRVTIEKVDVVSPHLDLQVRGWLQPVGDYPLDLQVAWAYRPPEDVARGRQAVRGSGTLRGTLQALQVAQTLTQPFRADVEALLSQPLFDLRFQGTTRFEQLDPRLFAPTSPVTLASGTMNVDGSSLLTFRAAGTARLQTSEWGELDSELRLARDDRQWRFERLAVERPGSPGTATWVGVLVAPEGDAPLRVEGTLAWQQLTWPLDAGPLDARPVEAGASPAVESARGTAVVEGSIDDYTLVVDGRFAFPDMPPGDYDFTARGDRQGMVVDTLRGRILDGSLAGSGRVRWKPTLEYTVQATATGLQPQQAWPVVPAALAGGLWRFTGRGDADDLRIERLHIENEQGTLEATGGVSWEPTVTWRVDATTAGIGLASVFPAVPAELTGGDWHVVADGTDSRAELSLVEGDFLAGRVRAEGELVWEPTVAWRFAGSVTSLDPAVAFPGWPGALSTDFHTSGRDTAGGLDGEVALAALRGTLRGRPVAGDGTIPLRAGGVLLDGVEATWGPAAIALDGRLTPELALAFDVRELELSALAPEASGVVTARGRVEGVAEAPQVTATVAGERLAWGSYRAARLAGSLALDLRPGGSLNADLVASDLELGAQEVAQARLRVEGTRERHRLTASATGEEVTVEVAAEGSLAGVGAGGELEPSRLAWSGTLSRLDLAAPQTGRWSLASPVDLRLAAGEVEVEPLCWLSASARLCAEVDWQSGSELALVASLEDLPLELLEPLLPPDVELAGTLDGSARLRTTRGGALLGEMVLRPSPGAAIWDQPRGEEVRLVLTAGSASVTADPGGVRGVAELAFSGTGTVRAELALPGFRLGRAAEAQPLNGNVAVRFTDLAFLEALVPELGATGGQANADLTLGGTLGAPTVAGALQLAGARAAVPRFGLRLEEIQLEARGTGSGPLQLSGSLRSGGGTLRISGSSPLLPRAGEPLRLELRGERVAVMDVDEAHVLANPDLEVVYDGSLVRVAGLVVVPEADIDYQRDRDRGPVEPSRDVVFVGAERPAVDEPVLPIAARVRVVLGDEVKLAALGLETELEGSLLIVEQPGVATSASGELRLQSGTFQAYGQDLVIDRGRLFFAGGPLTDPGIDLRAHRSVPEADVTAGIQATGTLRAPVVTLWSEPAMGESQVLSYLLLGRPLEATRAEEGSLLANAATALGVSGGNLLAEKLAARYGLEEASIQTGDTFEEAAFVVGKYLSPRLYVSYGIGLFNAVNTLRIRYLLSERLHLQAETGATTSGDVLYTLERGSPDPREIGEHLYRDLPRVGADELATPPKVPVGSGQQLAPEEEPTEPVIAPEEESEPDGR